MAGPMSTSPAAHLPHLKNCLFASRIRPHNLRTARSLKAPCLKPQRRASPDRTTKGRLPLARTPTGSGAAKGPQKHAFQALVKPSPFLILADRLAGRLPQELLLTGAPLDRSLSKARTFTQTAQHAKSDSPMVSIDLFEKRRISRGAQSI